MAQLTLVERITEPFTLTRAQREAEATPDTVRAKLVDALTLGRQQAEAASSLFDNGHPAEAIKLARAALESTIEAVSALDVGLTTERADATSEAKTTHDATSTEPLAADRAEKSNEGSTPPSASDARADAQAPWRRVASARGVSSAQLDAIAAVIAAVESSSPPRLDAQVTAEHAETFHRVLSARNALDRAVYAAALSPADVRAKRRNRLIASGLVLVAAIAGLWLATRRPVGTFASASAHFGNEARYAPENAIDGRLDTEWLLPDRSPGWLSIEMNPPRRVEAISIVNSVNPPHEDRATRDYTLEVWADGALVRTLDGTLPFSTARTPTRHEVGVDRVERVRIAVRSWHSLGGGLAEVTLE